MTTNISGVATNLDGTPIVGAMGTLTPTKTPLWVDFGAGDVETKYGSLAVGPTGNDGSWSITVAATGDKSDPLDPDWVLVTPGTGVVLKGPIPHSGTYTDKNLKDGTAGVVRPWALVSAPPADPDGVVGIEGPQGQGVPAGGTTGQVLAKSSNTDYDDHWIDNTATVPDASDTVKGITKLSIPPAVSTNPIALGANDPAVTNARTPTGSAGGDLTGTYPNPTIADGAVTDAKVAAANKDGAAATASMRTLGTGAQQAAAGNDARFSDSRTPTGAAGGDLTGTYPSPSLATTAVTPGTYGDADHIPVVTFDGKGRATGASTVAKTDGGAHIFIASQHGCVLDSNVSTGGGTDDTAALQAILNLANSSTHIMLILDGAALTTGLNVYSNTTIVCPDASCGLYLANNSKRAILRNANRSRGTITDQHITLIGGTYNGNDTNQVGINAPLFAQETDNTYIVGLQFFGVNYLTLRDVTVNNARAYAIHLANVNYLTLDNPRTNYGTNQRVAGQDGIHINGPASFVYGSNAKITSWDDAIALNAGDSDVTDVTIANDLGPYVGQGLIQDVIFDGVELDACQNGIRLLSHDSSSRINRVQIRSVTGHTVNNYALIINPNGAGTGSFGDLVIEGFDVQKDTYGTGSTSAEAWAFIDACTIESLTLRSLKYHQPGNQSSLIWIDSTATINSLTLDGFSIYDDQAGAAGMVPIQFDGYVKIFRGRDWNWYRSGVAQATALLSMANAASKIDVLTLHGVALNLVNNLIRQTAGTLGDLEINGIKHVGDGGNPTIYSSAGTVSDLCVSNWSATSDTLFSGSALAARGDAVKCGGVANMSTASTIPNGSYGKIHLDGANTLFGGASIDNTGITGNGIKVSVPGIYRIVGLIGTVANDGTWMQAGWGKNGTLQNIGLAAGSTAQSGAVVEDIAALGTGDVVNLMGQAGTAVAAYASACRLLVERIK